MKKDNNKKLAILHSNEIPQVESVPNSTMIIVGYEKKYKWIFLKCPCGCGDLLSLSLMKSIEPNWVMEFNRKNEVSIYPSVWKEDGCKSHFWIRRGRIRWVLYDQYFWFWSL